MAGIYVHVPFCKTKCIYCDFYSVTDCSGLRAYVRRLLEEIRERADELPSGEKVETVYFGGGTPSLLETSDLEAILGTLRETFPFADDTPEITLECNPGDVTQVRAADLVGLGINRISIGAQSFSPSALRSLSRRHTPLQTEEMVALFRGAGITNLTLDLIYGIPGTTTDDLLRDLEALIRLSPEHVSAYSLTYEEGTPLYRGLVEKKVHPASEDLSLEMAHLVRSFLNAHGYERYEISNYKRLDPRVDYRSRHNSAYWDGTPYLGFGPAAHSYVHPVRSWNPPDLAGYLGHAPRESETLTREMQFEEYLLTRLRTSRGIDLEEIRPLCTEGEFLRLKAKANAMTKGSDPLLTFRGTRLVLTDRGTDLLDAVTRDLV